MFASGLGNLLCDGVFIVKNSDWSANLFKDVWQMHPLDYGMSAGHSGDNAAFSAYLSGCTPKSTQDEKMECYDFSDQGYQDSRLRKQLMEGEEEAAAALIASKVLTHVALLPRK